MIKAHILSQVLAIVVGSILGVTALAEEPVHGVTDTEIVIGTVTDLSGVTAIQGVNNANAIRLLFDETNAKGGIKVVRSGTSLRIVSTKSPAPCRP